MKTPKVLSVRPLSDYMLNILYETGEERIFDVKPYLIGSWFGSLKDISVFNTVHPSGKTVAWQDGQDIAPHELYELSNPV